MKKIKKGDNVQVLLGKDSGKTGSVEKVLAKAGKVIILGINTYKRHVKKQGNLEGGVIDIAKPIDISNVALVCPACKKQTRVGIKLEGKEKLRFCKKCGKSINEKGAK